MSKDTLTLAEKLIAPLRALQTGWDSYGAPPINATALASATTLIEVTAGAGLPEPVVIPCSDGGVSLEWHTGPDELSFKIDPKGSLVEVFRSDASGEVELELTLDNSILLAVLADFGGRQR
jgi:hypothetical protein